MKVRFCFLFFAEEGCLIFVFIIESLALWVCLKHVNLIFQTDFFFFPLTWFKKRTLKKVYSKNIQVFIRTCIIFTNERKQFAQLVSIGARASGSHVKTIDPISVLSYAQNELKLFHKNEKKCFLNYSIFRGHQHIFNTRKFIFLFFYLFVWVLWHINLCKFINTKSIFIQINISISNNSV